MDFSYRKQTVLQPQKEKGLFTFLIGLLVSALFFVPYMIMGEGYFTFFGDFNVQQIPFYQMCHEAIKSGNTNWNWTTDLGANFIGSYSFYLLGSPFFWLTIPFPNSFVPYLMGPLLILKFGCAAFTGYLYIRRFTKTADAASIGGLLYAFSGFSIYNIFFNHFHEAIIVFPLLLLALELLITENRRGVFALSVCFAAVTNYFFFFGMVVFTVIYFFVRLLSGAVKVRFSRFVIIALEAIMGLGLAAVLLVPSLAAIMDNNRISSTLLGWNAITYGKEQIYLNVIECFFFPPDLPARPVFFPEANVKWSSLGGWMPVFSLVGVFVWFMNRKGSWLKRLIGICTFMAMVPILNSAFYAFNTAYYARWFYMPVLMMSLATVMLTEDRTVDWSSGFKWVLGITLGFIVTIGFFPQKNEEGELTYGLYTQSDDLTYVVRFWLSSLIAVVSLIILFMLIKLMKRDRKAFFKAATACVCAITVIYANVFVAMGRSHSYEIKDVMIDQLIEGEVKLDTDENYRIDVYDGVDNTGMYLGYPCINAFHSVVPASIVDFYNFVGVERVVATRAGTDIPAIRSLLSVKYLINRSDGASFVDENAETLMPGYEYVETSGGYYIYENLNYVPYGFSYDYFMSEEFCESYNDESRSRLMLKAVLLNDEQIKKYSGILKDLEAVRNLGIYAGEEQTVNLSLSDDEMAADSARLAETSAYSFEIDNYGFTAKVEREKRSLVFFSVPYDKGWSATVNGKKVDIEKVNKGFMAVVVDEGSSEIRFEYETPGLIAGLCITVGTLAAFLVYFFISKFYLKIYPSENVYPEGDRLIDAWHKDDIASSAEDSINFEDDYYDDYYDEEDDDTQAAEDFLKNHFGNSHTDSRDIISSTSKDNPDSNASDIPLVSPQEPPPAPPEIRNPSSKEFEGGFKIDPSAFDD